MTTISKNEMKEALLRSGYLLESRIADKLTEMNFFVEANVTYNDPLSQKSREVDLMAHDIDSPVDHDREIYHYIFLVIEAVNNPEPIILLKRKASHDKGHILNTLKYCTKPGIERIDQHFLNEIRLNEYCHGRDQNKSTQYCSFKQKSEKGKGRARTVEWMALHTDDLYETFNKLYHFTSSLVTETYESLQYIRRINKYFAIFQPLLVLQGDICEADATKRSVKLTKKNYMQFEFAYHDGKVQQNLTIDIVTEKYLPDYVALIRAETKRTFDKFVDIEKRGSS